MAFRSNVVRQLPELNDPPSAWTVKPLSSGVLTGDPATPYESTMKLADMLGVGQVVTWEGEGHTAYPETSCIRRAVDNYLIDLTIPAKNLRCPAS